MLRTILNLALLSLVPPILVIADLQDWLRDTLSLWRGRHRKIIQSLVGKPRFPTNPTRFAVVVWYPDPQGLFSLKNLLTAFGLEGVSVLLVATAPPKPEALQQIDGLYAHFILKDNQGRDFGAYRYGIEWLQDAGIYDGLDALILANDSLFYSQTGILRDLRELLAGEEPWSCLYESFRPVLHAQSFFQIFRRPLIHAPAFLRYWENYTPRSARKHLIAKGEIGQSEALTRAGFVPFAVYSGSRVGRDIYETLCEASANADLLEVLSLSMPDQHRMTLKEGNPQQIASLISKQMETTNPTHGGGLLCNWLFEAPLKRDLNFRGTHAVSHIVRFAQGFDKNELKSIERDLKRRAAARQSYVDKVLCRYGRK